MTSYCRSCGRPIKGEDNICEACKESIRAEAMGKQKKIAKQSPKEAGKLGVTNSKGVKNKKSFLPSQDEETEKSPRHFKSMAEYLEYLKGKRDK
jgi:hypothetical protein